MMDRYRLLLERARVLYERHEAGRPEPFNVFLILRKSTDEVDLHSRFLHALLCRASNLADFLRTFVPEVDQLRSERSEVERESDNIDIRIRDGESRRSVVIENKIWAGDQPRQLQRYAETEKAAGYEPHLVYLTLDGRDASRESAGDLEYTRLSYRDLPPWMKRCQRRAFDEPALRESAAQYLQLIAKLTGTNYSEGYMKGLEELCMEQGNLLLVHDLQGALVGAKTSLLRNLWREITDRLREIDGLSEFPRPPEAEETLTLHKSV